MVKFRGVLKEKIYLGILIIVVFAMAGSVWGARKESKEPLIGITKEDISLAGQNTSDVPELTGIFPLAAEQNQWYNFKYAAVFGLGGTVFYGISMAVYARWYQLRVFEFMRKCWKVLLYK